MYNFIESKSVCKKLNIGSTCKVHEFLLFYIYVPLRSTILLKWFCDEK